MNWLKLPLLFAAFFLHLPLALAHGGQPSFEKEVDGYLIDIGYDHIGIRPNETVMFDFDLFSGTGGSLTFAPFTEVQITFVLEGDMIIAHETLKNDGTNVPTMEVTFPQDGTYVLQVTYFRDGQELISTSFDVPVGAHNGAIGRSINTATNWVAGILVLLSFGMIILKIRSKFRQNASS